MRHLSLQLLTWGTASAAISSAVWLSSVDQASVFCSMGYRATSEALGIDMPLPAEPTRAGAPSAGPSSRAAPASVRPPAS